MSGVEPKEPARTGAEQDVICGWRTWYCYTKRPGVTAGIKRQIRRRARRAAKLRLLRD